MMRFLFRRTGENGGGGGRPSVIPIILTPFCFLLFVGITIGYVTWSVNTSEHKWCTVIELLNKAPAPKAAPNNPSRIYDAQLAQDFRVLQTSLGC
jgi:hypothetical protein